MSRAEWELFWSAIAVTVVVMGGALGVAWVFGR